MLVSVLEEEEFNKIIDSINDYMDSDDFYKYYYNPLINGIHRLGGEKELAYTVLPILIFKEVSCNSYERYLEILNMTPEELEENDFLDKILKNND